MYIFYKGKNSKNKIKYINNQLIINNNNNNK